MATPSTENTGDSAVASSEPLVAAIGLCSKCIDGKPCGNEVAYPPPHFCESCIKRRITAWKFKADRAEVPVTTWRDKLGNDVRRKLEKQKQATANLIFKVSPTPLMQVFSGLHNYLCELQPKNKGKHITVLKQLAGQRGGELVHHSFEILSGEMVAVFFKSTIVFGMQQGSVHIRDDGTVMAVIAPMTFHLKQKMPGHLNEPVMSVVVDTAALPADGIFRFDEESIEYSSNSKEHMKNCISRQLREILTVYEAMDQGSSNIPKNIFSKKQLVHIDYYAPRMRAQAQGP